MVMEQPTTSKPILPLLGYQQRFIHDQKRLKIVNKGRQIGMSTAIGVKAAMTAGEAGSPWLLLSAGKRQAKELLGKALQTCRAVDIWLSQRGKRLSYRATTEEIVFPGSGGRILALPANPDTIRGFTGNVVFDEFAHHKRDRELWAAAQPIITRGYELYVISTPLGLDNVFARLWHEDNVFSKHQITIADALAEGLSLQDEAGRPASVDSLRRMIGDEEAFRQEYMAEFLDESTAFLEHSLITAAEDDDATDRLPSPFRATGQLYLGWDVARWRDLSVMWLLERVGDLLITRAVVTMRRMKFSEQEQVLDGLMALGVAHLSVDATGMGEQPAERAVEKYGEWRVTATKLTSETILAMASPVRRDMEDRKLRIPASPAIRNDLHSVKKDVTVTSRMQLRFGRTDGHADRFMALLLARDAAGNPQAKAEYAGVSAETRTRGLW
jgi:phage FluMu gp28-like protein